MPGTEMCFTLNTGAKMPFLGLGTAGLNGMDLILNTLDDAFQLGYRLIDTDASYDNEKEIGYCLEKLLPKFNLQRSDIFITTKLSPTDRGKRVERGIMKSLRHLNCDYIDLFLMDLSCTQTGNSEDDARLRNLSWAKMVEAVKHKQVRQIGVCNYGVEQLEGLLARCRGVRPSVNQVEFHPFYRDRKLYDVCRNAGVFMQAYCILGCSKWCKMLRNEHVLKCAHELGKTAAQILLRWAIQQNVGVIPSSRNVAHLFANRQVDFVIPRHHMINLSTFDSHQRIGNEPEMIHVLQRFQSE
ncbi:unnamed protein product [Phyllotreta striolata]|uniref:NADP-dependent oxidoreductase domain-containing protein n=1 Tax=Phyllotreta striolata TaxID=444603 RepID=A0A9N9TI52_PHYSR|nr:unnamed protein product [Phyllotreta striolata]